MRTSEAEAMREYYVYIMTNRSGTMYVGVTNDLDRRVHEHKAGLSEFTARYRMHRLLYFESTSDVRDAIAREKQIKPWRREKKFRLIRTQNPRLLDLSEPWATASRPNVALGPKCPSGTRANPGQTPPLRSR